MITFPGCKINIGLNVIEKRSDGYHNIESCFYPLPWTDLLEVVEADEFEFVASGLEIGGPPGENLVVKAYKLLAQDFEVPIAKVVLHKILPMGAGLGGGSADGAFALKLFNDKFELGLNLKELEKYALTLGSDCPFFIQNQAAIATGRGEKLKHSSVSLAGFHLVIAHPGIHISSSEAYAGITPNTPVHSLAEIITGEEISKWKFLIKNDFELSVFDKYPKIKDLKDALYQAGALYASMSGSGSAVYGIFEETPEFTLGSDIMVKHIDIKH